MKTIEEILAAQQVLIDAAKAENRRMSDDEGDQYEALEVELRAATRSEEIEKRQAAYMAPQRLFGRCCERHHAEGRRHPRTRL